MPSPTRGCGIKSSKSSARHRHRQPFRRPASAEAVRRPIENARAQHDPVQLRRPGQRRPATACSMCATSSVDYLTPRGPARAVDHVSFSIAAGRGLRPGRRVGLRQEHRRPRHHAPDQGRRADQRRPDAVSGPRRPGDADRGELRDFRWRKVSIVFQSAMNALNPVHHTWARRSPTRSWRTRR